MFQGQRMGRTLRREVILVPMQEAIRHRPRREGVFSSEQFLLSGHFFTGQFSGTGGTRLAYSSVQPSHTLSGDQNGHLFSKSTQSN